MEPGLLEKLPQYYQRGRSKALRRRSLVHLSAVRENVIRGGLRYYVNGKVRRTRPLVGEESGAAIARRAKMSFQDICEFERRQYTMSHREATPPG
jgi:hypothetical protein